MAENRHLHFVSKPPRVCRAAAQSSVRAPIDRRALLFAAVVLPVAVVAAAAMPTVGAAPAPKSFGRTPFRDAEAAYRGAHARLHAAASFEMTDRVRFAAVEAGYIDAYQAANAAPVRDWCEFVAAFDIATDDGTDDSRIEVLAKLLADARRLAGEA